jgi:hypothetical protein
MWPFSVDMYVPTGNHLLLISTKSYSSVKRMRRRLLFELSVFFQLLNYVTVPRRASGIIAILV